MRRKFEIGLLALLLVGGFAFIFLTKSGDIEKPGTTEPLSTSQPGVAPDEVAIRNVLSEPIRYSIKPYDSKEEGEESYLIVGDIHRHKARTNLTITFNREGREVWRILSPGRAYTFRYDENDLVELWLGSHGRIDAEDLAPYVATPNSVVDKMLELARVDKDDMVYDIGCGDGRIVIAAAMKYGARGVGIDIDPERIRESKDNARAARVEKLVRFIEADATKINLSEATVVTLYLLPESNELLRPKLEKELSPGTIVVSHNYSIAGWKSREIAMETVKDGSAKEHTIYVYQK